MKNFYRLALALGTFAACAPAANASILPPPAGSLLLGQSVFGSVNYGSYPVNFFDPENGLALPGYSNKTQGSTVVVSNPAIEFGDGDSANTDTIDITDNTITLTDHCFTTASPALYTLKSSAFVGMTFTQVSNTYPGGFVAKASGNTLTLPAPALYQPGTYSAVYRVTNSSAAATPEPGSLALLAGMSITGAGVLRKRRRK